MGVKFNRDGMVLQAANGQLIQDSMMSAHSGKRIVPGGVLEKVPGSNGLFVRLLPHEARQLSRAQRDVVYEKARTWHAAQIKPDVSSDLGKIIIGQPVALDDLTLSQLQDLARKAALTGYSKLSKAALIDLLRAAVDSDGQPLVLSVDAGVGTIDDDAENTIP